MTYPPETSGRDPTGPNRRPASSIAGETTQHPNQNPSEKNPERSSIASDSDDDDFFHLDPTAIVAPTAAKPPPSPNPRGIHLSSGGGGEKPPLVPARYDVPDPNRIPMSIFSRTSPASPMDWSVASNESLFSIQMGNSSFSREHGSYLVGRSGDLGISLARPVTEGAKGKEMVVDVDELQMEQEEQFLREEMGKEKGAADPLGNSISRHSGSSTTSIRSFAFPVFTSEAKADSIKIVPEHFFDHQPPPQIKPPVACIPAAELNEASLLPHHAPNHNSARSRWFPCFSWRPSCC
ncbi:hypothetical protein HPP92_003197 [Vanilla planifolia]|uniref:Uncharacterized protein n=1 Tax=Vanilla planifolia TaxID=51239 RepID=A0A835VJ68_VANPL|nr:hypothetical protein HPP92_003197 [Vanilla planifolia]